jgi:methylated-DNA-protein-cysteine methyltransferase related protein
MAGRRRLQPDVDRESRRLRIVERVRAIPEGYVRTYGDIDPRAPRLVGHVRLLREGVPMRGDRVDLREARAPPDL